MKQLRRKPDKQDLIITSEILKNAIKEYRINLTEPLGENRYQNIENAIASYTAALSVLTRDAFPENWAMTQNNLGEAYRKRIRGDKAENIELAIASFTAALSVYTREAFPEQWAHRQNNLATAYSDRIRG